MNPRENGGLFQSGEPDSTGIHRMMELRKQTAHIRSTDPNEYQRWIDRYLIDTERSLVAPFVEAPEQSRGALAGYKANLEARYGGSMSRPATCANLMIEQVYVPLQRLALERHQQGGLVNFTLWYDASEGLMETVRPIIEAENDLRGETDAVAKETIEEAEKFQGFKRSGSQFAEEYLKLVNQSRSATELLRQDPSGYLLVEASVQKIRDDSISMNRTLILPFQISQFVVAGSEMAERVYKTIYPLT